MFLFTAYSACIVVICCRRYEVPGKFINFLCKLVYFDKSVCMSIAVDCILIVECLFLTESNTDVAQPCHVNWAVAATTKTNINC